MNDKESLQVLQDNTEKLWSYRIGDNTVESVPESKLKELISTGQLGKDTPVRSSDMAEWQRVSDLKALQPDFDQKPHPIIRFFARIIDLSLYSLVLAFMVGIIWNFYPPIDILYSDDPVAAVVTSIFAACTWAIWEPLLLATFGSTPGKWLFNIKVRTANGDKLTVREGFRRSLGVLVKGMAFGIPVAFLVTWLFSLNKLLKDGKSPWDRAGGFTVSHGRIGLVRTLFITILVGIYLLDTIVSLPGSVIIWY